MLKCALISYNFLKKLCVKKRYFSVFRENGDKKVTYAYRHEASEKVTEISRKIMRADSSENLTLTGKRIIGKQ